MSPVATADDPAMVAGCRAGQASSLEQFFVTHVRYVERVISRLTGPTPDLEDLVQTTFIQAFQSFGRYRGEASLKTWVTRIAVHTALHQLRSGVRRMVPLEVVSGADEPNEPNDPAEPADQQAASKQLARRLHALLDRIAPKKRVAFLLYTVEDYSIEEVAALTEASKAATKSRIWFARRELMAMVKGQPDLRQLIESSGAQTWR
jgi:RNA polymerase sigma-70 factor (ECF subfamily)